MDGKAAVRSRRGWPSVEDCNNLRACVVQSLRRFIGIIIVSRDHDALAGDDAKTLHIGAHGLGEHHPGAVVVRKGHRAFDAAGG